MGINIGTNFNYQGVDFLDSRQSMPKTLADLQNWDILVPEGFEAFVQGEWYIYKGLGYWNSDTGHWAKRSAEMRDYGEEIAKLMSAIFPMTFEVSSGEIHEIGESIRPTITWVLRKESATFIPSRVVIDGFEVPDPALGYYTYSRLLADNHTYSVRAWYDGALYSAHTSFLFKPKKYWGVISDPTELQDLFGLFSTWADDYTLPETLFDCSGGYYPVIAIPSSLWPGEDNFSLWVGGFRSTDYSHRTMSLLNYSEKIAEYEVVALNRKQTGVLSIRVGN